jgi:hypothetical protein
MESENKITRDRVDLCYWMRKREKRTVASVANVPVLLCRRKKRTLARRTYTQYHITLYCARAGIFPEGFFPISLGKGMPLYTSPREILGYFEIKRGGFRSVPSILRKIQYGCRTPAIS